MSDTRTLTDAGLPPLAVSFLSALIRHAATAAGAVLVAKGLATTSQEASFEQITSGGAALAIAIGWSFLQKRLTKKTAVAAVVSAAASK